GARPAAVDGQAGRLAGRRLGPVRARMETTGHSPLPAQRSAFTFKAAGCFAGSGLWQVLSRMETTLRQAAPVEGIDWPRRKTVARRLRSLDSTGLGPALRKANRSCSRRSHGHDKGQASARA